MKYLCELSREFKFEAAHSLPEVSKKHKCAQIHGHSFKIKITIRGNINPNKGWIIDYGYISKAFAPIHKKLNHKYLNNINGLKNPTSELLALYIAKELQLPTHIKLFSIEVKETCTSACTIYPITLK